MAMFKTSRFLMLAAALTVAVPMAAQQTALDSTSLSGSIATVVTPATSTAPAAAIPAAGPVIQPAGVVAHEQSAPLTMMPMPVNGENSQNTALMLVGGAGLIVGALIGGRSGTIVMVGSGILGLVGLFRYLQ
jgi:hypothetical protein